MNIWDGNYVSLEEAKANMSEKKINEGIFEEQMFELTKSYWKSYGLLKELKSNSVLLEACVLAYYYVYDKHISIGDVGGGVECI